MTKTKINSPFLSLVSRSLFLITPISSGFVCEGAGVPNLRSSHNDLGAYHPFCNSLSFAQSPLTAWNQTNDKLGLCYHWFNSGPEKNRKQIYVCNGGECSTTTWPRGGGWGQVLATFLDKWWTAPETESNRFLVPRVLPSNMSMFSG